MLSGSRTPSIIVATRVVERAAVVAPVAFEDRLADDLGDRAIGRQRRRGILRQVAHVEAVARQLAARQRAQPAVRARWPRRP